MFLTGGAASSTSGGSFVSRATVNPERRPSELLKQQHHRSVASTRCAPPNGDVQPCTRPCGRSGRKASFGSSSGFLSLSWRRRWGERWRLDFKRDPSQTSIIRLIHESKTQKRPNWVRAAAQVPQNADLPLVLPKKKKKPKLTHKHKGATTSKHGKRRLEPILRAPENGLLVKRLIPIAHDVLEAKAIVTKGVNRLLEASTVWTCRFCTDVHVGLTGHALQTCQGPRNNQRHSLHDWIKASTSDLLLPVEAYHLEDRLALPIAHEHRFDVARISAVEELCIQAGVDFPEYPTRRYSEAIRRRGRERIWDATWMGKEFAHLLQQQRSLERSESPAAHKQPEETSSTGEEGLPDGEIGNGVDENDIVEETVVDESDKESSSEEDRVPLVDLTGEDDLKTVAEKTLRAWERMRAGAKQLKTRYRVVVCGYCPEVHVGPKGHRAQSCGAFKHQWRNGQHGWQSSSVDDLIPPQYVWHVRDRNGPQFHNALKRFYGKAPAVVELCIQAGASVPDCHIPLLRLDIVIPNVDELEHVI